LLLLIAIVEGLLGVSRVRGSNEYIRYLVLWISFAGAMITTREERHISLSILAAPRGSGRRWLASIGVLAGLLLGSSSAMNFLQAVAAVPSGALPAGLAPALSALHLPVILLLLACIFLGAPIFVLLGGLAALLFLHSGGALETRANQVFAMLIGEMIASIPLSTLAGYIISESKAGERLVRLFRALLGRLPGDLAFTSVLICAFVTTFTGASGVTIIAVGSLLFPPSLPVILYGVVAMTNIKAMFVAGILSGFFLVISLAGLGIWRAFRDKVPRTPFDLHEALPALKASLGEILLPFLILALFLLGITTLVETGAVAVLCALVLEALVHRDLRLRQLPTVFVKSVIILGGILDILTSANALSYYNVDAEVPTRLA
jgi:C4-dicarboxylate transporter DctM subunit